MEAIRRYKGVFIAAFALTCAVSLLSLLAWYEVRAENQQERRDRMQDHQTRLVICRELEAIKTSNRLEAIDAYERRADTYRLLGLERNPALEKAARDAKNRKLAQNAPIEGGCHAFAAQERSSP